jgi:hypothetical protein
LTEPRLELDVDLPTIDFWLLYERDHKIDFADSNATFELLFRVVAFCRKYECQRTFKIFKDMLDVKLVHDLKDPRSAFKMLIKANDIQLASEVIQHHGSALEHNHGKFPFRWTKLAHWSRNDIEEIGLSFTPFVRAIEAEQSKILSRPKGGRDSDIFWPAVAADFVRFHSCRFMWRPTGC